VEIRFRLKMPLIITSRLTPGTFIGDSTVSVEPTAHNGSGQFVCSWSIDTFSGTLAEGNDLTVSLVDFETPEVDLPRKAIAALLGFLTHYAEEAAEAGTINMGTTRPEVLWAHLNRDEIAEIAEQLTGGCRHSWVAGMMHVSDEDLDEVYAARHPRGETIDCERCEQVYTPADVS
jgi:hypothetical protein